MTNPANTTEQNLLPVQAYFDVDGNFQTFIGQGKPFYATVNPDQSGLHITSSTIDSTTIGATTPARVNTNALKTTGLTGYLYGHGNTGDVTASPTIPWSDLTGVPSVTTPAYGGFHDTTIQTVSTINTPTKVSLNTTDFHNGMSLASNRITITRAGLYNLAFSLQVTNSDTVNHDMDLWIRQNGTDVPASASVATVLSTHGGQPGYGIVAANFFIQAAANDYIEFWWSSNSTQVSINTLPAITTPFASPAAPSIVVTLHQIA